MAIYHFKAQHISRGKGRSATAAAAYRSASVIRDERTGEVHDYTRKGGVVSSEILAPNRAPEWARDREQLWNMAEISEKRKDGRVAREVIVALPHELSMEDNKVWLHGFVNDVFVKRKMVAQVDIHDANREGDKRNIHAHILLSTRQCTRNGFSDKKPRVWDERDTLIEWREKYADHMNRALEKAKVKSRVDHRSYADQGVEKMPTKHLGPAASSMERRKKLKTRIGDENRAARSFNEQLKKDQRALENIKARIEEQKARPPRQTLPKPPSPTDPATIEKDRDWWRYKNRKTAALDSTLADTYQRKEKEAALEKARDHVEKSQGWWASFTGQKKAAEMRLAELEAGLANVDMREQEMRGKLRQELAEEFQKRFPGKPLEKDLRPPEPVERAQKPQGPPRRPEQNQQALPSSAPPQRMKSEFEKAASAEPRQGPPSAKPKTHDEIVAERLAALKERQARQREQGRDRGGGMDRER